MAFSAPCPDLLSPLLEEHSWRRPCGSWEAACRLAVLSKAWRDEVNAWRAFERTVKLDLRADIAAVKVVAKYCRNLQCLDLRGCTIKQLGTTLLVVAKVCPQLKELQLGGCTAIPTALRMRDWARHCPQLLEIDFSDWVELGDLQLLTLGQSCPQLRHLNLRNCKRVTHAAVAKLVEELKGLVYLNLADSSPSPKTDEEGGEGIESASRCVAAIGSCRQLQRLHLRGSATTDGALAEVLSNCPHLTELDLSSCAHLTDASVPLIASLPKLVRLCLADTSRWSTPATDTAPSRHYAGISARAVASAWPELGGRWADGWGCLQWRGDQAPITGGGPVDWLGPPQMKAGDASVLRGAHSIVGRTRTADIRIGHNWPMPYISSRHMRLYHWIVWPRPPATPHLAPRERQPVCEAWLHDLSQNGTFVNRKLVGVGKHQRLHDGDLVEVFNRDLLRHRTDLSIPNCIYNHAGEPDDVDP